MALPRREFTLSLELEQLRRLCPPPPLGTHVYLEGADRFPFEGRTGARSAIDAWWLAELSLLAYDTEGRARQVTTGLAQPDGFQWLDSPATGTQGFVLESADRFIVVFRGTELPAADNIVDNLKLIKKSAEDFKEDLKVRLTTRAAAPAFAFPVHMGFATALAGIWPDLAARLASAPNKPVWTAGHSLGAALAVLAAYQVGADRIAGVYAYGMPCVGGEPFVTEYARIGLAGRTYRYVNGDDLVVSILDNFAGKYRHVGAAQPFNAVNWSGLGVVAGGVLAAFPFARPVIDHAPLLYAYETWNAIP